jgi:hypothetical protein
MSGDGLVPGLQKRIAELWCPVCKCHPALDGERRYMTHDDYVSMWISWLFADPSLDGYSGWPFDDPRLSTAYREAYRVYESEQE